MFSEAVYILSLWNNYIFACPADINVCSVSLWFHCGGHLRKVKTDGDRQFIATNTCLLTQMEELVKAETTMFYRADGETAECCDISLWVPRNIHHVKQSLYFYIFNVKV